MKKIISLFFAVFLILSCSEDESSQQYKFTNQTPYTVIVKPATSSSESPMFSFKILPGETKIYKSEFSYTVFDITSEETTRHFRYNFDGDSSVIYSFEKMLQYKISGTASTADIVYKDAVGNFHERTAVTLPYTVSYDAFGGHLEKFISATSNQQQGTITVEVLWMDVVVEQDSCSGEFCTASITGH